MSCTGAAHLDNRDLSAHLIHRCLSNGWILNADVQKMCRELLAVNDMTPQW